MYVKSAWERVKIFNLKYRPEYVIIFIKVQYENAAGIYLHWN